MGYTKGGNQRQMQGAARGCGLAESLYLMLQIVCIGLIYHELVVAELHFADIHHVVTAHYQQVNLDIFPFPRTDVGYHTVNPQSLLDLWDMLEADTLEGNAPPSIMFARQVGVGPVMLITEGILADAMISAYLPISISVISAAN